MNEAGTRKEKEEGRGINKPATASGSDTAGKQLAGVMLPIYPVCPSAAQAEQRLAPWKICEKQEIYLLGEEAALGEEESDLVSDRTCVLYARTLLTVPRTAAFGLVLDAELDALAVAPSRTFYSV